MKPAVSTAASELEAPCHQVSYQGYVGSIHGLQGGPFAPSESIQPRPILFEGRAFSDQTAFRVIFHRSHPVTFRIVNPMRGTRRCVATAMAASFFFLGCIPDLDREETELELIISGWPLETMRLSVEVTSSAALEAFRQDYEGDALRAATVQLEIESIPAGLSVVEVWAENGNGETIRRRIEMVMLNPEEELRLALDISTQTSTSARFAAEVELSLDDIRPSQGVLSAEQNLPTASEATAALDALAEPPTRLELLSASLSIVEFPGSETNLREIWRERVAVFIRDDAVELEVAEASLVEDTRRLVLTPRVVSLAELIPSLRAGSSNVRVAGMAKDEGEDKDARVRVELNFVAR